MDYLDIRKNAYIDALSLSASSTVVSLWGRVPWEIVESFGFTAIYSYGIDGEVTKDYSDNNYCDMLNSSFAYLELGKCPFMYSSSFFIVDDSCKLRYETLKKKSDKDVFVYKYGDYCDLIEYLELKSNTKFNTEKFNGLIEKSREISSLIVRLRECDLDEKLIYEVEYFSKFIFDIDSRIDFIKKHIDNSYREKSTVKIQAGAGVYKKISQLINEGFFCEGEYHDIFTKNGFEYIDEKYRKFDLKPDYVIHNCNQFDIENKQITY
ncbi:2-hydroxyacyl-CoA dehydratase family protein [uncultured Finegoldia sp.]|uniref:2-hydroxyacyl-CoA dehydratase family protein n=1 Tax=uncultured Finegoldia sp. TaxID=328009 RepID=UPI002628E2D2|nr:2-hydroxyacyl-CoA dehydratase family protein [uncultured Finegoldia sp.]